MHKFIKRVITIPKNAFCVGVIHGKLYIKNHKVSVTANNYPKGLIYVIIKTYAHS